MRVPTYKQQTGFGLKGGGGGMLTASLNPSAATAVARTVANLGDDIFQVGMKKLEVEIDTEVGVAKRSLVAEFENLKLKNLLDENPIQAERKTKGEMLQLLRKYSNGLQINPVTNKPYLTSNKSKARFMKVGQELYSAALIDYVKKNNARIVEINKTNISNDTDDLVKNVIDGDKPNQIENFNKIFSTNQFNPGILTKALINGDYKSKEYTTAFDNALEGVIDGLVLKEMKSSSSALSKAMEIVDGKSDNVVLNNALGMLDADKRLNLREKIIKLGKEFDDDRNAESEKQENDAKKINDDLYAKIINIDTDNANELSEAIKNHKILKSKNYYETTSKIKETELFLGIRQPTTKGSGVKSDVEAIKILEKADQMNILTAKLVEENASKLSTSDFKFYMKAVRKELDDGFKKAHQYFKTQLNYNEFSDTTGASGEATKMLFNEAKSDLEKWERGERKAGRAVTFASIEQKAIDIYEAKELKFRKIMKNKFVSYLNGIKATMNIQFDPNKPLESAKKYIENNPSLFNPSDMLVQGLLRQFQAFEKFNIDQVQ